VNLPATPDQISSGPSSEEPQRLAPLDEAVDHVRGRGSGLILAHGDYECGFASGAVRSTPTLFIDGLRYHGSLDREVITGALTGSTAEA
jgi:hypothetical protein